MQTFSRCFAKIHKYLFLQKNICRIDECEYVRMFVLHNICKARLDNALYTGLILLYLGRVRTAKIGQVAPSHSEIKRCLSKKFRFW